MTVFMSPVEAVQNINIRPFPSGSRALKSIKAIAQRDRTVMAIGANGTIYSNDAKNVCYTLGMSSKVDNTFILLQKLGALTKEQVKLHILAAEARSAKQRKYYAAKTLQSALADSGMRASTKQARYISENIPKETANRARSP